jgi:regulator of cell morphogenesis and NO signaling
MEEITNTTLKNIVTKDFRAAAVFEKYSLDFCCRGGKTIGEACRETGLDPAKVLDELRKLDGAGGGPDGRHAEWPVDFLADYIVNTHHAYVREAIPVLEAHTAKIVSVHGANHPELVGIAEHFRAVAREMTMHMMKEERMLFPFIKALALAGKDPAMFPAPPFGSVRNPIAMMEAEHQEAGDAMAAIRSLSREYTPPEDACTTYRVTFQELKRFEEDLHQHVHLENNILFPKAVAIEDRLAG